MQEIEQFKHDCSEHDYTERLLYVNTTRRPDATVRELYDELIAMERSDAANILYQVDRDMAIDCKSRVETPV